MCVLHSEWGTPGPSCHSHWLVSRLWVRKHVLSDTDTPGISCFPVSCPKNQPGSSHLWTQRLSWRCHGLMMQEENHFGFFPTPRKRLAVTVTWEGWGLLLVTVGNRFLGRGRDTEHPQVLAVRLPSRGPEIRMWAWRVLWGGDPRKHVGRVCRWDGKAGS